MNDESEVNSDEMKINDEKPHIKLSKETLSKISEQDFMFQSLKELLADQKNAYEELIKCLKIYIHVHLIQIT